MAELVQREPAMQGRRPWIPGMRRIALAAGVGFAFWIHATAFSVPVPAFYQQARWPYIAAGMFAMAFATVRPGRWMVIAIATATPTALMGCYYIGKSVAEGGGVPWVQVRVATTMLIATCIGAIVGRVAGGIRRRR